MTPYSRERGLLSYDTLNSMPLNSIMTFSRYFRAVVFSVLVEVTNTVPGANGQLLPLVTLVF